MYIERSYKRLLGGIMAVSVALGAVLSASAKPVNVPVVYYKLPNGLRVVISEDHVAPVVTVAVYYNVGFCVEPRVEPDLLISSST